jgi:uncharacterized protein YkwD
VLGRTLVERISLLVFIVALAATVMVYLSRNSADGSDAQRLTVAPTRSSEALGANTHPTPKPATATSTPTLGELLIAADQVQRAQDFFEAVTAPTMEEVLVAADQVNRARDFFQAVLPTATPTLAEVLVAADQVQRAQDFFRAVEAADAVPTPTLAEILVAADQVNRLQAWAEAAAAAPPPVTQPAPPPPPAPTNTPVPPPPPAPTDTPIPPPPAAPPQSAPEPARINAGNGWYDTGFEAEVMAGINARRAAAGLGPLTLEPRLTQAAKDYAKVLADYEWFNHTGPDGSTLVSRIEAAGFPFTVQVGEVLAWGSNGWPPEEIVQAWIDSPSHREQIMAGVYTRAGIGCYFTQEDSLMVRCVVDLAAG